METSFESLAAVALVMGLVVIAVPTVVFVLRKNPSNSKQ